MIAVATACRYDERMASITIRDLDEETKERLRRRAAARHRSMEEEVRQILREVVARDDMPTEELGARIIQRFADVGGVDLELPGRQPARQPPDLDA